MPYYGKYTIIPKFFQTTYSLKDKETPIPVSYVYSRSLSLKQIQKGTTLNGTSIPKILTSPSYPTDHVPYQRSGRNNLLLIQ